MKVILEELLFPSQHLPNRHPPCLIRIIITLHFWQSPSPKVVVKGMCDSPTTEGSSRMIKYSTRNKMLCDLVFANRDSRLLF